MIGKIVCSKCKREVDIELMARNKSKKSGFDSWCKQCHLNSWLEKCKLDPDHSAKCNIRWKTKNPERYLYLQAKHRAERDGVFFDIKLEDIEIPEFCPALGIKLQMDGNVDTSPSLDRLIPNIGYVKENIKVISMRANRIKNDATLDELKLVTRYVESELADKEVSIRG